MTHPAIKAILALAGALIFMCPAGFAVADSKPAAAIPTSDLIQPGDLASSLKNTSLPKPLVLHVGFRSLFVQAHIPGSEYVGAASEEAGLQTLRGRVAGLSKSSPIVIYCGCCPWSHCPNIAAAYFELHSLGFTAVRALYIADNFGDDWVIKGFPVAKGP